MFDDRLASLLLGVPTKLVNIRDNEDLFFSHTSLFWRLPVPALVRDMQVSDHPMAYYGYSE